MAYYNLLALLSGHRQLREAVRMAELFKLDPSVLGAHCTAGVRS